MTAIEAHDLLYAVYKHFQAEGPLYRPGRWPGFPEINYCRFCGYSEAWTADHGHGDDCLYAKVGAICSAESEEGSHG